MPSPLVPLAGQFLFSHALLGMVTSNFGPGDWAWKHEKGGNSAHWLLGHVTTTRRGILRRIGVPVAEAPWETQFTMGGKPGNNAEYPSPETLVADFQQSGRLLSDKLGAMTAEEADAPWANAMPDGSKTLGGALRFFHFHETYHLGQVGLIRRQRGLPGFI